MPKIKISVDDFGLYIILPKSGTNYIARPLHGYSRYKENDVVNVWWQQGTSKKHSTLGVGKESHHTKGQYNEYWVRIVKWPFMNTHDVTHPSLKLINDGMFLCRYYSEGGILPSNFHKDVITTQEGETFMSSFSYKGHQILHNEIGPAVLTDAMMMFFCNGYRFYNVRAYAKACGSSDETLTYLLLKYGETLPYSL